MTDAVACRSVAGVCWLAATALTAISLDLIPGRNHHLPGHVLMVAAAMFLIAGSAALARRASMAVRLGILIMVGLMTYLQTWLAVFSPPALAETVVGHLGFSAEWVFRISMGVVALLLVVFLLAALRKFLRGFRRVGE